MDFSSHHVFTFACGRQQHLGPFLNPGLTSGPSSHQVFGLFHEYQFSASLKTRRHSALRVALLSITTFFSQCLSLGRQPARTPQGRQWKVPFRGLKSSTSSQRGRPSFGNHSILPVTAVLKGRLGAGGGGGGGGTGSCGKVYDPPQEV